MVRLTFHDCVGEFRIYLAAVIFSVDIETERVCTHSQSRGWKEKIPLWFLADIDFHLTWMNLPEWRHWHQRHGWNWHYSRFTARDLDTLLTENIRVTYWPQSWPQEGVTAASTSMTQITRGWRGSLLTWSRFIKTRALRTFSLGKVNCKHIKQTYFESRADMWALLGIWSIQESINRNNEDCLR